MTPPASTPPPPGGAGSRPGARRGDASPDPAGGRDAIANATGGQPRGAA